MLIAQISDLHIAPPGEKTLGHVPMDENLRTCVDHINAQNPKPDVVVISGDITDQGDAASARYAREMLDALSMPYYVVPGNHDDRAVIHAAFAPDHCPAKGPDFINYTIDDYDIRLIGLDSTIHSTMPGGPGGALCPKRLNWLEQKLAEAPDKPSFIFLHHPPLKCGVRESDEDDFTGAEDFGALIRQYHNVLRISCGHIHLVTSTGWCGTIVGTTPSTGMRLRLDLTQTKESAFFKEAPSLQLHLCTPEGNLVTHTLPMGASTGAFAFAKSKP